MTYKVAQSQNLALTSKWLQSHTFAYSYLKKNLHTRVSNTDVRNKHL